MAYLTGHDRRSVQRRGTVLGKRLGLVVVVLAIEAGGRVASASPADELPREISRALRLFFREDPERQEEGAMALRRLGRRAAGALAGWIARTERRLVRASRLLEELDPGESAAAGSREAPELRRFLLEKLEDGWSLLEDGKYREAREIADALIALDGVDSPRIFDYRRLWRASEKRTLASEVLEPAVHFRRRVLEIGDTPRVRFRLTNHREEPLVINARRGILGVLSVYTDRSLINGQTSTSQQDLWIHTFNRVERIVVPAREHIEIEVPVKIDEPLVDSGVVLQVRASGRFRPSRWGVDDRNVNLALEVPETVCWVVPRGMLGVAVSPARKMEAALILRDFPTFFVAGQLAVWLAQEDPLLSRRLLKLLVRALPGLDEVGFRVVNNFLLTLTGVPRGEATDREFWTGWYEKHLAAREGEGASGSAGPAATRVSPLSNDGQ